MYTIFNTIKNWFLSKTKLLRRGTYSNLNYFDPVMKKRREVVEQLDSIQFPSIRMEKYRFTNFSKLKRVSLAIPEPPQIKSVEKILKKSCLTKECLTITIVNGTLIPDTSHGFSSSYGLHIGNLSMIRQKKKIAHCFSFYDDLAMSRGSFFTLFNSATCEDAVFIIAEPGVILNETTLHLVIMSSEIRKKNTVISSSIPRIFIWAGENTLLEVIEEYISIQKSCHITTAVMECYLSHNASIHHRYIQMESQNDENYHIKSTLIDQEKASRYKCTEVSLGANISRHDLSTYQRGPDTISVLGHFLLISKNQFHDLHSKISLYHQNSKAEQLHKCIISHSTGRGVFNGSFEIKQYAIKTDARQLSRNLLISPKATVNIKPNLQITADDVKCAHGCTVSDLALDEIFYFATRGIDEKTTRQAIVFSFGSEIVDRLDDATLEKRINQVIKKQLVLFYLS